MQQLDMESNGKSVTQDGTAVALATAPIIWGSEGTNGQHAFHQLLHQGTSRTSIDFILPMRGSGGSESQQQWLVANCLSQAKALMNGQTEQSVIEQLVAAGTSLEQASRLAPHKVIRGNKPSNTITMESVTPEGLGALIALYEHKVFCQGVIWDINSFDQWGVELGKSLSEEVYQQLDNSNKIDESMDSSSQGLIKKFWQYRDI